MWSESSELGRESLITNIDTITGKLVRREREEGTLRRDLMSDTLFGVRLLNSLKHNILFTFKY